MAKRNKIIPRNRDNEIKNAKIRSSYQQSKSKVMNFALTPVQQAESAQLYEMAKNILLHTYMDADVATRNMLNMAQSILGHIEFDVDAGSRPLEKAVHKSDIRGKIQTYLEHLR